MRLPTLLWLLLAAIIFLAAATASRTYVATNNILFVLLSLTLYCAGNLVMIPLMREGGLGLAISVSAVAQLLLVNVIAFLAFGERLSAVQLTGVALGIVAMGLMLIPGAGRS